MIVPFSCNAVALSAAQQRSEDLDCHGHYDLFCFIFSLHSFCIFYTLLTFIIHFAILFILHVEFAFILLAGTENAWSFP